MMTKKSDFCLLNSGAAPRAPGDEALYGASLAIMTSVALIKAVASASLDGAVPRTPRSRLRGPLRPAPRLRAAHCRAAGDEALYGASLAIMTSVALIKAVAS
ncbi:MAG: hypothetical protein QGI10_17200, partial [Vicinamibacterales bacterium]|nr:hypothetical protein [Vicinamibacterales bacterium]